jgi:hypothetical protein
MGAPGIKASRHRGPSHQIIMAYGTPQMDADALPGMETTDAAIKTLYSVSIVFPDASMPGCLDACFTDTCPY